MSVFIDGEYDSGYEAGYDTGLRGLDLVTDYFTGEGARGFQDGWENAHNSTVEVNGFAVACAGRTGWFNGSLLNCCGNCRA